MKLLLGNEDLKAVWDDYVQLDWNNDGELCPQERTGKVS